MPKRRGHPPQPTGEEVTPRALPRDGGHLLLSFRHLRPRFGVTDMTERQRSEFLVKWAKRCAFTWKELAQHPKHGLGFEMLPRRKFKPALPVPLQEDEYREFRHDGNLPFAGIKVGDTFYVLWVETRFGELYDHA